jgi:peptidoglycan/LPS O-acetylase OafA/YrhL
MGTDMSQESPLASRARRQRFSSLLIDPADRILAHEGDSRGEPTLERPMIHNLSDSANLDALRATAVLLVLASHVLDVFGLKKNPVMHEWGLNYLGSFGVLMFFVHTSLVLMMSMDRLAQTGGRVTLRFYIRRLFRIYPLSVLVAVIVLALRIPPYFEPQFQWPGPGLLVANLFLVQNLIGHSPAWTSVTTSVTGPLWSLPFEVQMYLVLPCLYQFAKRIRSYEGVAALMCLGFAAMFGEFRLARAAGYPQLLTYAPWFLMGVCAYTVFKRSRPMFDSRWYGITLLLFVALPCLAYRLLLDYRSGWANWGIGFLFAMLLPYFSEIRSGAIKTAARVTATYSYGIYLSHVPILWFAFQRLHNQPVWLQVSAGLGLLATVPIILYHFVEAPMIRVGARIALRMAAEPALAARI